MLLRGSLDWFFDPEFLDGFAEDAFEKNDTHDIHYS